MGLFAGVGGLEAGFQKSGHHTELLCEVDPVARAVLDRRFPDVAKHDDVTTLDSLPRTTDCVVAGFPCQDLSQAGRTVGIAGSRSGLVGEVFRLVERARVPWVVLENVPFMLQLARGQALEVIVSVLERLGYRWAYRVVDTRAFGLPQRRRRVFLVASLEQDPRSVLFADDVGEQPEPSDGTGRACGFYWTEGIRGLGWAVDAVPTLKGGSSVGVPSPPAIWLSRDAFVTPDIRDAERLQGFSANWTQPAETVARPGMRWKLVGNAVSVPVAAWLGRRLARPGPFPRQHAEPLGSGARWPEAAWNTGHGRFSAHVSAWPRLYKRRHLEEFLAFPVKPLSVRATAGFLSRARKGKLRFPRGFLEALDAYLRAEARRHGQSPETLSHSA